MVKGNLFRNAGTAEEPGIGIDLAGAVAGVALGGKRIVDTAAGHMQTRIRIGEQVTDLTVEGNQISGAGSEVGDQRPGACRRGLHRI